MNIKIIDGMKLIVVIHLESKFQHLCTMNILNELSGTDKLTLIDHDDAEHDILRKRIAKLADICQLCKKTHGKII